MQLKLPNIFARGRLGRTPQKRGKPFAASDMSTLRVRRKLARCHILDHPTAKSTDPLGHHDYSLIEVHTPIVGKSPKTFIPRLQCEEKTLSSSRKSS